MISCGNTLIKKSITLESGSYGVESVCLETSELQVECGGGDNSNGVTWDIKDSSGNEVLSGGCDLRVSNCAPCLKSGGKNLTVYLNKAQLPHGGEWWDLLADSFVGVIVGSKKFISNV